MGYEVMKLEEMKAQIKEEEVIVDGNSAVLQLSATFPGKIGAIIKKAQRDIVYYQQLYQHTLSTFSQVSKDSQQQPLLNKSDRKGSS